MIYLGIVGISYEIKVWSPKYISEVKKLIEKQTGKKKLMEKQTSKKIKVSQFDHVGEYKDQFLQFGQNNGIGIHFTEGIHGLAKEVNRSLLRRFGGCCLMHD